MWEEVARRAAEDAGAPQALERLDSIDVVYSQSWQYDDPPARLAARLGATRAAGRYSGIGGSVPQTLLGALGDRIASGEAELGLVVGAEALATVRRLKKDGRRPDWSFRPAERRPFPFDVPFHPAEVAHAIFEAYLTFALFDQARRAHLGRSFDDHRAALGRLLAPQTELAAAHPDASWFPVARTAEEITVARPDNRMVAFPYTKLMTAIMDVDMAAAVLMTSDAAADELGVPADRRVYLRGWAYAQDPNVVAERRDLWRSAAMKATSDAVLTGSGIGIDDVAHLDVYSCFASSICFAVDALGISDHDAGVSRPVSVTGGLAYHGGPGSNYMTHSIAAMVERLRDDPGAYGLVSGVGMHMTKHVYGLWSTEPGTYRPPDLSTLQKATDAEQAVAPVVVTATGPATVATFTVLHGRDGSPEWAALVCDLPVGSRCYARVDDPAVLADLEGVDPIGKAVTLEAADDGANRARF
jgi:acetyl-CoA C-acetyltransferase